MVDTIAPEQEIKPTEKQQKEYPPASEPPDASEIPSERLEHIKNNNEALWDYILEESVKEFAKKAKGEKKEGDIPLEIPPSLRHILQVRIATREMARRYKPKKNPDITEEEKRAFEKTADTFAQTHDMGRIYEITTFPNPSDRHPLLGKVALSKIGFDKKYQKFAKKHHIMGTGTEDKSIIPLINQPDGFAKGIQQYIDELGKEALPAVLADLCKDYIEGAHNPRIAPFTQALGDKLIKRQLELGSYKESDTRHTAEVVGVRFLLAIKDYLKNELGIDYNEAIAEAQAQEDSEMKKLSDEWEKKRLQVIESKKATLTALPSTQSQDDTQKAA